MLTLSKPKNDYVAIDADRNEVPVGETPHVAVTDRSTNLMWLVAYVGGRRMRPEEAVEAVKSVDALGFNDWRVPTIYEAPSTVDYSRCNPAIDELFFPGTKAEPHCTSSAVADAPADFAWFVHLNDGYCLAHDLYYTGWVRAVRSVVPSSSGQ